MSTWSTIFNKRRYSLRAEINDNSSTSKTTNSNNNSNNEMTNSNNNDSHNSNSVTGQNNNSNSITGNASVNATTQLGNSSQFHNAQQQQAQEQEQNNGNGNADIDMTPSNDESGINDRMDESNVSNESNGSNTRDPRGKKYTKTTKRSRAKKRQERGNAAGLNDTNINRPNGNGKKLNTEISNVEIKSGASGKVNDDKNYSLADTLNEASKNFGTGPIKNRGSKKLLKPPSGYSSA